jgi:hypothetical protein
MRGVERLLSNATNYRFGSGAAIGPSSELPGKAFLPERPDPARSSRRLDPLKADSCRALPDETASVLIPRQTTVVDWGL